MPRPTYLDDDTVKLLGETRFDQKLGDAVSGVRGQGMLDSAIRGIRQIAYGDPTATTWKPLPIVVSDRPDANLIAQQQRAQAASGTPVAMPTTPDAATPDATPTFKPEDFHYVDGRSEYRPSLKPGEKVNSITYQNDKGETVGSSAPHGDPSGGVEQWNDPIQRASQKYNVPSAVIKGIMHIESGGQTHDAQGNPLRSSAGAISLMQVMPFHFTAGENPDDPETNIDRGTKILADNYARYHDWDKAAAAYFGAIDANGNITGASDGNTDGYGYVRQFRDAASRYQGGQSAAPTAGSQQPAGSPSSAPAAASTPSSAAGASPKLTVRDPWGNTFQMTQQQIDARPGGSADLTVVPNAQSRQEPAAPWADQQRTAMSADQSGDMLRQPLQATGGPDSSTGQEYDPRDADQGAHESGYTDPAVATVDGGATQASGQAAASTAQTTPVPTDPTVTDPASSQRPDYQFVQDTGANDYPPDQYQAYPARPGADYQMAAQQPGDGDPSQYTEVQTTPRPTAPTYGYGIQQPGDGNPADYQEVPIRPRPSAANDPGGAQFLASDSQSTPVAQTAQAQPQIVHQSMPSLSMPDLTPVYDGVGNLISYIKHGAEQVGQQLSSLDRAPETGNDLQGGDSQPEDMARSGSVARALTTPIKPPERPAPQYGPVDLTNTTAFPTEESRQRYISSQPNSLANDARALPYQAAEAGRQSVMEAAQSFADAIRAGQEGRPLAAAGNALWATLQTAGLPWTVAARTIDEALPEMTIMGVGPGDAMTSVDVLRDGIEGVNALKGGKLGDVLSPDNLGRADEAVSGIGSRVRGALSANAERAAADEGVQQLGSGFVPNGRQPQTVEVLQQRLQQARSVVDRLVGSGDAERLAMAQENRAAIESQLADAVNARRDLEPRIASDVGRRADAMPSDSTAERAMDAQFPQEGARTNPSDLSGPVSVVPDMGGRMNSGVGPDAAGGLRAAAFNAAQGGVLGAASEDLQAQQEGRDADPSERARRAVIGGGLAVLAGNRAARGAVGRLGEHLGSGVVPERPHGLGNVPPSKLHEPHLPGMEPPRRPMDPALRGEVSPQPNTNQTLAQSLENQARRQSALPGMADPLRTGGAPAASAPATVTGQTLPEALPGIIRNLNNARVSVTKPATTGAAEMAANGAAGLEASNPGVLRRISDATGKILAPWTNRLNIVRYTSMLSDTAGQVFNITGNAAMGAVDLAATPIAVGLDRLRVGALHAGDPAAREVFMAELPAKILGRRMGAGIGLRAAGDVLQTGVTEAEAAKLDQATRGFGTDIPGLAPAGSRAANVTNFTFEAPLRALAAADAAFRTSAMGGYIMSEAVAAATRANNGLKPTAEMIRAAAKDPELLERAQHLATRDVLQEDRGLTKGYQELLRHVGPVGRAAASIEIPFSKTPWNVVAQGVGLTPAALAGVVNDMARGTKPARQIEYNIARAAIGTTVGAVAFADYANGNLTGPRPTDPKEISTLPPGWREWSRKVPLPGGQTFYLPLAAMGPLAFPAVAAILVGEAKKKGASNLSPEWAGQVALGLGRYGEQATFFGGLNQMAQTLENPDKKIQSHIEQIAAQFAPDVVGGGALGREIQRVMGMPSRDPEGALDALLATFPYQDQVAGATGRRPVEVRQDVLGRPASLGMSGPASAVIRGGVSRNVGVIRAYRDAAEGLPLGPPKQVTDPGTKEQVPLSTRQQHQWRREFGDALQEGWDNYGNPDDSETLQKIRETARSLATQSVLGMR